MRTRTYLKFGRSIDGKPKSGLNIFQKVNVVYIRFFQQLEKDFLRYLQYKGEVMNLTAGY